MRFDTHTAQELIATLKEGIHEAFNELHRRYYALMIRYAYNILRDKEECTDLVQDVLTWFWEHRQQHNMNSIKGYLMMAVKYKVANYIRRGKLKETYTTNALKNISYTINDEALEVKQLQTIITSFTLQLPEKCGIIFKMSR